MTLNLKNLKEKLKGVIVVMVTPFKENGEVNFKGLEDNTSFLAEKAQGRDFIFTPTGSTGEFYALTDDERKEVIKRVIKKTDGRVPIFAGAAHAGTKETIEMAKYAESVGADGVQIVLPYYHIPDEEGMYRHFATLAESINIGIMVYNNPRVTGSWIKPSLMARLAQYDNIVAVKENTPDIMGAYDMIKAVGDNCKVFTGLGEIMYSFESLHGACGFVTGNGNFDLERPYRLYEAASKMDYKKVQELIQEFHPYYDFISRMKQIYGPSTNYSSSLPGGYISISVYKEAMNILGLCGGKVRLPLIDLSEEHIKELKSILRQMKLL